MIKLNFNDLEIFITVCEEASINKAAIKLRYAQSNISQRISKLENELGVVLLFRNQKGAKATKAGEEFLAYSKKVLRDTETIKNKMKNNTMSILCSELLFNYLSESEEIMMSNNSINFISSGNIRKAIKKIIMIRLFHS